MKLPTITAAALVLSACSTVRYTPVYCIGKDQAIPAEPPKVGESLTGRADRDFQIIAGSNVRLRAWGQGLRSVLDGCREK